ncbi:hypothetical protein [Akkermansia sp.]|uniref:hypothetical protein n=1 Tax=Akkermansia sp. TaxID=1872421 RepID=UPI0025BC201F|nr:hypothetical protein [Akkermansia sp.]MCD8064688.1 hypothetical protein [Akkermansia sp.]
MNKITTVNGVLVAAQSDFADHAEDKTIHLTEEERTAWNAKADASALTDKVDTGTFTAHESNPTVHVTQEEREKWNAKNTKGVVTATQDGLDEHTENTTVHITEEERAAWNEAAAIPGASNAFTGDNTHAGTETFNGPVLLKGSVTSDDLRSARLISRLMTPTVFPLCPSYSKYVIQWGPMGFLVRLPSSKSPVIAGGIEKPPMGWWSQDVFVIQVNLEPRDTYVFELSSCRFVSFSEPPEDGYAFAHTLHRPSNTIGSYVSIQVDCKMRKFRLKYHHSAEDYSVAQGVLSIYEWDMPEDFFNLRMARVFYVFRRDSFDVYYINTSGELKCLAVTPGSNGYAINFAQMLFYEDADVYSAFLHVGDTELMDWLNSQEPPYSRSKWCERNSDAPSNGIVLPSSGGQSSFTLNSSAGCAWILESCPDWLETGTTSWENGGTVSVSAASTDVTRRGVLILVSQGNHGVADVKAYEKIVITQTIES